MRIATYVVAVVGVLVVAAGVVVFEGDLPKAEVDARYSNQASRFLNTKGGARIHYRDQGNRNRLPIVLIHGAMASLHTWEPWVAILGDHYRVITLDLPGHGLTGAVPAEAFGVDAFTETINAVVDALNIDRFVLAGNSMGGGATWRYALAHPQRVIAMILVDASAPAGWQRGARGDAGAEAREGPVGFALLRQGWFRAVARYLDPKLLVEQGLRSAYNNSPVVDDALVTRYYQLIMREGTRAAILERSSGIGATQEAVDLRVLDQPTLVMWGAQDALIPPSVADQFARVLPDVTSVVYDDLGHVPMEEDPERSAADVIRFLGDLEGRHTRHDASVDHAPGTD